MSPSEGWALVEASKHRLTLAPDPVHSPILCLQVSGSGGPDHQVLHVTPGQCWAGRERTLGKRSLLWGEI